MKIRFSGFEWDKGNITKCLKRGISQYEIESFFKNNEIFITPDIKHSDKEQRFLAIGRLKNNRPVFVAFTLRKEKIRPISARYMHKKEIKKYEEEFKN